MTFEEIFRPDDIRHALERGLHSSAADVRKALLAAQPDSTNVAALLSPAAAEMLEELAQRAHSVTVERFGKTIALFAPLYLSNECVCTCTYCGFSMGLDIKRKTLRIDEVAREANVLASSGIRNILLVSSEHPKHVGTPYISQCIAETKRVAAYVAVEVAAAQTPQYESYVEAGCDGVVLYQETYDPDAYRNYHLGGPKKHYASRLSAPERAAAAGVRHLGIGALLGLADWRFEGMSLVAHAHHLMRHCWRAQINVSFPRINAAAGGFAPPHAVTDAQLVQLMCAMRIALPAAGIVLSTRERAELRDRLLPLGVTHLSAGSSTEPGGYSSPGGAGEQFHLEDTRPVAQVARRLAELGYDPVFKDWEPELAGKPACAPRIA